MAEAGPPAAPAEDSDSDFDGFDYIDVLASETTHQGAQMRAAAIDIDSDIYFSSDENDEEDQDLNDRGVNLEWEVVPDVEAANDIDDNADEFTHDFRGPTPGPVHNLSEDSPVVDFFHLFFDQHFFEYLVFQTNLYAEQQQNSKGTRDPHWAETTAEEMKAFFGIHIIMALQVMPNIGTYWCADEFLGNKGIQKCMTKNRFEKLLQYMHVSDNERMPARGDDNFDPLYKVRPVLDMCVVKFKQHYNPQEHVSVDEMMVGFKGRLSMRQYMPAKPTKWGIKVWALCESQTGYTLDFDVYTGKKDGARELGLGFLVVRDLMRPYWGRWHKVYFDNFFSSSKLFVNLFQHATYSTGTVRSNRKGCPPVFKTLPRMQRGDVVYARAELPDNPHGHGTLTAAAWQDKKTVFIMSTSTSQGNVGVERRVGNQVRMINCPMLIRDYNMHMGGVDLADQRRSYYPVGRESKKWWRYLLWFCVNVALINSFMVWKRSFLPAPREKAKLPYWKFMRLVADGLMGNFSRRKVKCLARLQQHPAPEEAQDHRIVKLAGRKKHCQQCSKAGRRTRANNFVQSTWECSVCHVCLCKERCFDEHHGLV